MSLTNVDIAQRLGYTTKVVRTPEENKVLTPRLQYNYYTVATLDSKGYVVHEAYYSDPNDYRFIINHCISVGVIPDWTALINVFKDIRSKVNAEIWSEMVKEMEKW